MSPTTNTMLKTALYSGYLNSSFLTHVELFAELFSGDGVVYILKDEEWRNEDCLLSINVWRKSCLIQWIHREWKVKQKTVLKQDALQDPHLSSENSGHWHEGFFVHVREDCCTWSAWFPPLSWCSYFGGYLLLKRTLPEDRDSGWSVFPSPCLVPQPVPQVAGWAALTEINHSHKLVPFSLKKSPTATSCWLCRKNDDISTVTSVRETSTWHNPFSLSKFSPVLLSFSVPPQQSCHQLSTTNQ